MSVQAPGWDIQCDNGLSSYQLMSFEEFQEWSNASDSNQTYDGPAHEQTIFHTALLFGGPDAASSSQVVLDSSYKSTLGINGTLSWRNCTLNEAVIRNPLQIVDGVVTLQSMPLTENRTEYLVYRNYESNTFENAPSTVGGTWLALYNQYYTSANITTQGEVNKYVVSNENAVASQFVTANSDILNGSNVAWSDPTDTIIAAANEITLRAAIALSDKSFWSCATCAQPEIYSPNLTSVNRTLSQRTVATIITPYNAYQTDLAWLVSGCGIITLVCLIVAPMYWGWWSLERRLTLNPFETAKAFDAPLLRSTATSTTPIDWSRDVMNTRVHYGMGPQDTSNMVGNVTGTMTSQPHKVYAMHIVQGDRYPAARRVSSISHEWSDSAGQPYEVANDNISKFRKVD